MLCVSSELLLAGALIVELFRCRGYWVFVFEEDVERPCAADPIQQFKRRVFLLAGVGMLLLPSIFALGFIERHGETPYNQRPETNISR